GFQSESLDHKRAEHDSERGQHDQIPKRERLWERDCGSKSNNAAHAGPGNDEAASYRGPQHWPRWTKTKSAISPSDDSIKRHVPNQPYDDHGQQHGDGNNEVSRPIRRVQAFQ